MRLGEPFRNQGPLTLWEKVKMSDLKLVMDTFFFLNHYNNLHVFDIAYEFKLHGPPYHNEALVDN